jgi:hypothetical protein
MMRVCAILLNHSNRRGAYAQQNDLSLDKTPFERGSSLHTIVSSHLLILLYQMSLLFAAQSVKTTAPEKMKQSRATLSIIRNGCVK